MPAAPSLPVLSWLAASATFAAIWLLYVRLLGEHERARDPRLEAALIATAFAAATSAVVRSRPEAAEFAALAELLEPLAWMVALTSWIGRGAGLWAGLGPATRRTILLLAAVAIALAAIEPAPGRLRAVLEVGFAAAGFLVLALVLRALDEDRFWQLKYLLAAVVAILAFDLATGAAVLAGAEVLSESLDPAEAILTLLVAPLVLVSLRRIDEQSVGTPRPRSMAAGGLAAGLVTLYAATVGWLAFELQRRLPGLGTGLVLAGALFAILALALAVASGTVRAAGRRFLGRITGERFDYEREWMRFLETVAGAGEAAAEELPVRVIRAVADAVDATGGAIWLHRGEDRYELLAIRNLPRPDSPIVEAPGLAVELARLDGPLELDRLEAAPGPAGWPGWLPRPPAGWLVLPLVHRGALMGLLVLAEPRAGRMLDPAERRLLRILAREAASYLAEDRAARALAESRQFTAFSRRFAFLTHDLKNVVAELGLAAANARRHLDDPAFRVDLLRTLDETVGRLRRLLERLREDGLGGSAEPTDLVRLLAEARGSRPGRRPRLVQAPASLSARVDGERLLSALRHLVDNGFEATRERGPVELGLRRENDMAIIEVKDGGPGLPPEIARKGLFRPFATTKPNGLGLGLVAARDLVESLGGRLEVESRPGQGTTARIYLPRLEMAA
ncbi:MAG: PEP-CTERM system histidine kinase PrsK [Geminicoccaceae bacterium]|nr:PEP-CTERM system histidine kinase PrsK [Geminicoccaceae bacterium]MDW8370420.1 PEP-CTERM system histidine kinase PrsK [Geminicoccaceae bacterium]